MRIAIVGSGIAGLVAAYVRSRSHHVELFERDARLLDPRHMRMLVEIRRDFRQARRFLLSAEGYDVTLREFLDSEGFSSGLTRHFVLPLSGAIWSVSWADIVASSARTILQFYENHCLRGASMH